MTALLLFVTLLKNQKHTKTLNFKRYFQILKAGARVHGLRMHVKHRPLLADKHRLSDLCLSLELHLTSGREDSRPPDSNPWSGLFLT